MTTSERGGAVSVPFRSGPLAPMHRGRAAALLLGTAFTLSTAYVGYLTSVGGLPDGSAAAIWASQLTGFATAALVLVDRAWVWWLATALVTGLTGVGILMYSVLFVPGLQSAVGWFVNDIHLGLLVLTVGLCVHRLRGP